MIQPLEDRVIVLPDEAEDTTRGGIILAEVSKERPCRGTVLAVGPGKYEYGSLVPMAVQVGDTVFYSRYGGVELRLVDETYLVLRQPDILGVVERGA